MLCCARAQREGVHTECMAAPGVVYKEDWAYLVKGAHWRVIVTCEVKSSEGVSVQAKGFIRKS
jgi:hypothetical protein